MADDKIRIRFVAECETVPSEYQAVNPSVAGSEIVQTELNAFITAIENGTANGVSANPYLERLHYVGASGAVHLFFGVMEILISTPLGQLFFEEGRYANGIWVLSAAHKGAVIVILDPLLYFPAMGLGIDTTYSIHLTSIEFDDKNYTVEFPEDEAALYLRGPGGATVRMFDEIELEEDEILLPEDESYLLDSDLALMSFVPYSGPGGATVRAKRTPRGKGKNPYGPGGATVRVVRIRPKK